MLELVSHMQWPFAMVCITFLVLCGVVYVTQRLIKAREAAEENNRLVSENYRLAQTKPGD